MVEWNDGGATVSGGEKNFIGVESVVKDTERVEWAILAAFWDDVVVISLGVDRSEGAARVLVEGTRELIEKRLEDEEVGLTG